MAFVMVVMFATLPFAELWAANVGQIDVARLSLWWGATLAAAFLPLLLARSASGQARSAVFVAIVLYLGFRYPLIGRGLDAIGANDRSVLLGWSILALLCIAVAVPLSRRPGIQLFMAVAGAGLLLVVGADAALQSQAGPVTGDIPAVADLEQPAGSERPNIWLIVPDGYSRADVIARRTQRPIGTWQQELADRNFRLPAQARSNYPTTWASLPSLLDMEYVIDEGTRLGDHAWLHEKIAGDNGTVRTLRAWGYEYVHAFSGAAIWEGSRCMGLEDRCIGESTLTETDWGVLRSTPLVEILRPSVFEEVALLADPRRIVSTVLDDPPTRPYFVFVHLMSPHPPFTRDESCRFRPEVTVEYVAGAPQAYRDMVECLNQQLLEAVDDIVRVDPEAMIVLHSDHGHDWGLDWDDPRSDVWTTAVGDDRWPVLSALRLPDDCVVADDLSNVDVMRLVFACLGDEPFEPTPYQSWITVYHPDVVAR